MPEQVSRIVTITTLYIRTLEELTLLRGQVACEADYKKDRRKRKKLFYMFKNYDNSTTSFNTCQVSALKNCSAGGGV